MVRYMIGLMATSSWSGFKDTLMKGARLLLKGL